MLLSAAGTVDYLRARGLGAAPARAGAPWQVQEASSRNRNFAVLPADGEPGWFVKQLRVTAPASVLMMQREATVYWLANHEPDFAPMQALVPDLVLFDGAARILVLALLPKASNLMVDPATRGHSAVVTAERLGLALATLHHAVGRKTSSDPPPVFPREVPGIFTAHRGGPLVQWLGPGQRRLVERVCSHPRLPTTLDRLAASWTFDSFVHGDVKLENCVASYAAPAGAASGPEVKLVDWELADFGDACWDLGCTLQAYLYVCVRTSLGETGLDLGARLAAAGAQAAAMRDALGAFWRRYCAGRGLDREARAALLERTMGCAAARLLQMALEVMHGQAEPPSIALSLFEASDEVAGRPLEAAGLLGLLE